MTANNYEQGATKPRSRRRKPWREDIGILSRLPEVERRHLAFESNTTIARALGVEEGTIRLDIKRLEELWLERIGQEQETLRARVIAELMDVARKADSFAEFDAHCERAVLFGEEHALPNGQKVDVQRDAKGAAQFRGQKATALNVRRQAVMDQAKILGLVVDKQAQTDDRGRGLPFAELLALARQGIPHGGDDAG